MSHHQLGFTDALAATYKSYWHIPSIRTLALKAHTLMVGDTQGTNYGKCCPEGEWKDYFLADIEERYDQGKVHVYLTYPSS